MREYYYRRRLFYCGERYLTETHNLSFFESSEVILIKYSPLISI